MTFYYDQQDAAHQIGATKTLSGGSATSDATTTLAAGSHTIYVVYSGDPSFNTSTGSTSQTVSKAHLTVTADNQSKTYDGQAFAPFTATLSGFVNGETSSVVSGSASFTGSAVGAVNAGSYTITPTAGTLSAADYDFTTFVNGTLTVNPRTLHVSAAGVNKVYDGTAAATVTLSDDRVAGDAVTTGYTASFADKTVGAGKSVSVSGITISGADAGNYTANTTASTTASITARALTIAADNKVKVYGAALPALTVSYSGFVNGDTAASLTTPPTLTTAAAPASPVANYSITASGAVDSDYTFTYVPGTLTVTKRTISVVVTPSPGTINKGQTATVTVTVADTSGAALVDVTPTGTVSWSASGPLTLSSASGTLSGSGGVATYTVTVTGLDGPGGTITASFTGDAIHASGSNSASLTVLNTALTVGSITAPLTPQSITTTINASAGFTDPGTVGGHTAVWSWGDNTTSAGTVTEGNGSGSVTGSHVYATDGVFTITLTVTNKGGAVGTSTFQYVVIYNPSAGFVTGGGWINSPAGADVACPSQTGRANFGFVAKYLPGRNTPSGQTQFQLKLGNLDFHSTSYDWLTISNNMAQYQGSGTINSTGNYKFVLTAVEGDLLGGTGPDTFRIRIWDPTVTPDGTGTPVYDNYPSGHLYNDPSGTPLSGGQVVIHKSNQAAAGGPGHNPGLTALTLQQLQPVWAEALARWEAAGATPAQVSPLAHYTIQVVSVPSGILAMTGPGVIWISPDAAGYGWFIDPTPADDAEFKGRPAGPGRGRMDLLSVVAHEMGHVILQMGESAEANDVMTEALPVGVRRMPTAADLAAGRAADPAVWLASVTGADPQPGYAATALQEAGTGTPLMPPAARPRGGPGANGGGAARPGRNSPATAPAGGPSLAPVLVSEAPSSQTAALLTGEDGRSLGPPSGVPPGTMPHPGSGADGRATPAGVAMANAPAWGLSVVALDHLFAQPDGRVLSQAPDEDPLSIWLD